MPTIRTSQSLAANATAFPLQGNQYEYMQYPGRVEFAIIAAAAGVQATVFSGSDVLQQSSPVSVKTTPPVYPDDFLLDDVADAGERLSIEVRNTTGAAIVVDTVTRITPL